MLSLFVVLLGFVAVADARAAVFTTNQRLVQNASPAVIPVTYDNGLSFTGTFSIGSPAQIVYGIKVTSSNANSTPVSLQITLPSAFSPTLLRCYSYPGGTPSGSLIPACSLSNLSAEAIGALSAANDKVIVVIDGYFNQAGAFTAGFVATRGATQESTSLNMAADVLPLSIDLGITKEVKPKTGGAFGSTASVPFGSTVTYKIKVTNLSPPDPIAQSTDVYLGPLLKLQDTLSAPNTNDVNLSVAAQSFSCTASLGAACPTVPATASASLGSSSSQFLAGFAYPSTSNGFLPAGGFFEITFDAVISTTATCSPGQNNKLLNSAFFTYSNGTQTVTDSNPANNTSTPAPTVTLTGLPITSANCTPTSVPNIQVAKVLQTPSTGAWGTPFTYKITITNNSNQALTGLGVDDYVTGSGTPPFTATFSAASVTCTPACISPLPVNSAPVVYSWYAKLFSAWFSPLAPGAVQTVVYTVQYDTPCATSIAAGSITNLAVLTGPAKGQAQVTTGMPALPLCSLAAVKKQTSGPTSFSTFPVTLGYNVQFQNTSPNQTIRVGTLVDAMAFDSPAYGLNVPIDYAYTCTTTSVTMPSGASLVKPNTAALIKPNTPTLAGVRLIDFSSLNGTVFAPLGKIDCNLSVTLKQPPTTDSLCQGAGKANVENVLFMDLFYQFNTNQATPASRMSVITPLPKCVSILVGKTVEPNVFAGSAVTFTLTVKNVGNDPVANVTLTDNVPSAFTNVAWTCASGCATSGGSGNNISVPLNVIPPGATVTIKVTATAPSILGSYCNSTNATFNPFPPLSYFEGDQKALTTASACVQVESPPKPKFVIRKNVEGAPEGFKGKFTFLVQCSTPSGFYQTTVSVNWPTPGFSGVSDIPAGSQCLVTEGPPPSPLPIGYHWSGLPVCAPQGCIVTTSDNGGEVTLTNKLAPCSEAGQVKITKIELGLPKGFSGVYTGMLQCWSSGKLLSFPVTLTSPGGLTSVIGNIPLGSTCTFQETALPALPGSLQWLPPVYSPDFGTVTLDKDCCPEIKATNEARLCCPSPEKPSREDHGQEQPPKP